MQANLDEMMESKAHPTPPQKESSTENPTEYSYIFLRVQPFTTSYKSRGSSVDAAPQTHEKLQFVLHLEDPGHKIVHTAVTQAVPANWLAVWDKYDWVEDAVVEVLRVGVEVLGQEYIATRMSWTQASTPEEDDDEDEDEDSDEEEEEEVAKK
jgi:hypothetical protein